MTQDNSLKDTIERIFNLLKASGLQFHFTGGIASSYHGEPRFTQDVDIVVRLSSNTTDTQKIISLLENDYIIDREVILDCISKKRTFQALDQKTFIKIDFYGSEKIPNELSRSIYREILPGITIPLVSAEDSILSKLIWVREGSDKAKNDIKGIVLSNKNLDLEYLKKMSAALGLSHLLEPFII